MDPPPQGLAQQGHEAVRRDVLLPAVERYFGYRIEPPQARQIHRPQLLFALQHHCAVELADDMYDFELSEPVSVDSLADIGTPPL